MPTYFFSRSSSLCILRIHCVLISVLLLVVLGACNLPADKALPVDPASKDVVTTSVAETVQAGSLRSTMQAQENLLTAQALTLQAPTLTPTDTPMPTLTWTPIIPTDTPTPIPTWTLLPPTDTPTFTPTWTPVGPPRITATIETNCRTGPSPDYPRVGYLLVGQESTVHGINAAGTWWYIANPTKPGQYCWVWGETTVVAGSLLEMPIITPPPPPGAAFQASFVNDHICGGVQVLTFWVKNTGGKELSYSSITMKDLSTNTFFSGPETSNDPFLHNAKGCGLGAGSLAPGEGAYIIKGLGFGLASGTDTRAIIILCTEDNQGGECIEVKVNFDFP